VYEFNFEKRTNAGLNNEKIQGRLRYRRENGIPSVKWKSVSPEHGPGMLLLDVLPKTFYRDKKTVSYKTKVS
jgi:hypothetical protein